MSLVVLNSSKWPYMYAQEYMDCKTKKDRQRVADSVPAHFKELVKLHIKISRDKAK